MLAMPIVLAPMIISSLNDAIEVYETALRFEPDNADVHYNVSLLWENPCKGNVLPTTFNYSLI